MGRPFHIGLRAAHGCASSEGRWRSGSGSRMRYIMEAADEGRRLLRQGSAHPSLARLAASGLRSGMSAIDVGCGSGAVLAEILELVGDRGNVVGLEPNADRIAEASSLFGDRPNLRFIKGALPTTGIRSESFDYVWCQFVCE